MVIGVPSSCLLQPQVVTGDRRRLGCDPKVCKTEVALFETFKRHESRGPVPGTWRGVGSEGQTGPKGGRLGEEVRVPFVTDKTNLDRFMCMYLLYLRVRQI